jgi:hypothetical protein
MRPATLVFARFESKGKPMATQDLDEIPVSEVIFGLAKWITDTAMGHSIRVTIARSAEERESAAGSAARTSKVMEQEAFAEGLAALMAGLESPHEPCQPAQPAQPYQPNEESD